MVALLNVSGVPIRVPIGAAPSKREGTDGELFLPIQGIRAFFLNAFIY
uniref:Alternative protein ARPC1B n=1 Tax=Homo sapiens TaxID=9606 RepID=L8EAG6_HUMAN|nr:alternative protein ARPC1B [Homo sapiens]